MSHTVPNQRFLALDDISLNATVVEPPLPEDVQRREHQSSAVLQRKEVKVAHACTHTYTHCPLQVCDVKVSPGVAEDSPHASIVWVSILDVVSAAASGSQLFFII